MDIRKRNGGTEKASKKKKKKRKWASLKGLKLQGWKLVPLRPWLSVYYLNMLPK